jgi:peptidyl-tRNA hydrolase, PTH1 family
VKLIVGLGNPGSEYAGTRHNIGFSVITATAQELKASLKREFNTGSRTAKARINSRFILLALPRSFMNLSGSAVARLVRKYKIGLADLLVVCDDLDLEFGRIRLRKAGSSGGHRGLESVIENLQSSDFPRLRIGVGRPPRGMEASEYVLQPFDREERGRLEEVIEKARACCETWAAQGTAKTMNIFNQSAKESKDDA